VPPNPRPPFLLSVRLHLAPCCPAPRPACAHGSIPSARRRPETAQVGLRKGSAQFVKSLGSGLSGMLRLPAQGYKSRGTSGMLEGLAAGATGLVCKPTSGALPPPPPPHGTNWTRRVPHPILPGSTMPSAQSPSAAARMFRAPRRKAGRAGGADGGRGRFGRGRAAGPNRDDDGGPGAPPPPPPLPPVQSGHVLSIPPY
jgi:hypothetical protein